MLIISRKTIQNASYIHHINMEALAIALYGTCRDFPNLSFSSPTIADMIPQDDRWRFQWDGRNWKPMYLHNFINTITKNLDHYSLQNGSHKCGTICPHVILQLKKTNHGHTNQHARTISFWWMLYWMLIYQWRRK